LSTMDKGTRVDQIGAARERLRKEGIRACYFLQFGYPGENWQDIQQTIALVRDTGPDDIGVSVSYPLPGTKFFERVRAQLGKKTNWSDSEDLSMMFQGAYTDDFYRALHDALHAQVDARNSCRKYGSPTEQSDPSANVDIDGMWAHVEQLEKTCRNSHCTVLESFASDALVQLQPDAGPLHSSGND
jgi:anaerobic magnesium-protoporphyrin IX monomethyl ester cyclase